MIRTLTIAFALTLCALALADDAAPPAGPASIAVVRTWEELEKQPPITLADGKQVRLGIESDVMPRHGSVLVYLMIEGHIGQRQHLDALGPLRVHVSAENVAKDLAAKVLFAEQERRIPEGRRQVFARSVHAESDGEHTVELLDGEERIVARTRLMIGRARPAVWWPLRRQDDAERGIDDATYYEELSPDVSAPANPCHDGATPVLFRRADAKPPDAPQPQPLPRAVPDPDRHEIKLSVSPPASNEYWLTLELPAQAMLGELEDRLLVRWFVNGQQLAAPLNAEHEMKQARNGWGGHVGNRVRVELVVPAGTFGKLGGERIGVQVMWCPDGWRHARHAMPKMIIERAIFEHDGPRITGPIVSNRVEFQLPHTVADAHGDAIR